MKDAALAGNLILSPSATFAELRERPRFWFPLLVLIASSTLLVIWYYSMVDIDWLKDMMFSANENFAKMPEDQRARMMGAMSRNSMLFSAVVSTLLVVPAMCAVQALYFLLAGKVAGIALSYRHWFTMAAWCALPAVIGAVAGAAVLLSESSPMQILPTQLQVLSLNELFFQRPMAAKGATLLSTFSLLTPLSWALLTICVKTWSGKSWLSSATFALLPSVVIYGTWALIAFR